MTESKLTRCPGCATVFRITAEQLAFREGQVRCGHCRAVFDANDHFVSLDSAPPPDAFLPPGEEPREAGERADEIAGEHASAVAESTAEEQPAVGAAGVAEQPTVEAAAGERPAEEETETPVATEETAPTPVASGEGTLTLEAGEAASAEPISEEPIAEPETGRETGQPDESPGEEALTRDASDIRSLDEASAATEAADAATAESSEATTPEPEVAAPEPEASQSEVEMPADRAADAAGIGATLRGPAERFEWKKKRRLGAVSPRLYAIAMAVLVVGLVLQLVLEYRDTLAAYVPATRPLLAAACKPLDCTIGPLRDGAALSIDASDLQADPAHRGLLLLSATIRNRAGHAIAFPYLELMLTDSSDRVVVRRAFPPVEYASGSADIAAGIPPNGEHVVRLFLDASATQQAGYRVYLFYP